MEEVQKSSELESAYRTKDDKICEMETLLQGWRGGERGHREADGQ
jgi:hypothetical protein